MNFGATLRLTGLNPAVLEVVRCSGLAERLDRERLLLNVRIGIERYLTLPPAPDQAGIG